MIAIIGAMQEEVNEMLALVEAYQEVKKHNVTFYEAKIHQKDVVIVLSGIGKVNAAISTTVLLQSYPIKHVINIGTAGGLKEDENELDIIVSTKVAQFDIDVPGENWVRSFSNDKLTYACDSKLVELTKDILSDMTDSRVFTGPIVTSDMFIYQKEQVQLIQTYYPEALCAEMEAGAVAQVCRHFNTPFIVVRSLSDITIKEDNHLSFDEYIVLASKRSAKLCSEFVKRIG